MRENALIWEMYQKMTSCDICNRTFIDRERNHCPHCLCTIHLDIEPGDKKSDCRGVLRPVHYVKGEITHKCEKCGIMQYTSLQRDDNRDILKKLQQL